MGLNSLVSEVLGNLQPLCFGIGLEEILRVLLLLCRRVILQELQPRMCTLVFAYLFIGS